MEQSVIVTIGEVVWDQFPSGAVLGGAPLNVAYHLQAGGLPVLPVSRLGADELGARTREQVAALGLPTSGMQEDDRLATGRVLVSFDERHEPHFDIAQPAAWDAIDLEEAQQAIGRRPFHLVFGSLAQRQERSRATIQALWPLATSRFYDVNLRPPFTGRELVEPSLRAADVVKVNGDELRRLCHWFGLPGKTDEEMAHSLLAAFGMGLLIVTRGSHGAFLLSANEMAAHNGFSVKVADTVGSGDAFFAGVIGGYLRGDGLADIVVQANRLGAYVASRQGATPDYDESI